MKGKLLKAILVMCLCLMPVFEVGAATNDSNNGTSDNLKKIPREETEKDDLNRYRTGKVGFSYFNRNDGKQCSTIWVFSPNKGSNVSYMYAVKGEYGALLIYGRGSVHCDIETIKNPDSNAPESSSGNNDWSLSLYDGGKGKGFACSAPSDENKTMTYYTNIPIFSKDNLDAIKAYEESGDISGAENEYDISQPDQDDSVELPKNLRSYGKIGYIDFNTDSTVFGLANGTITYLWDLPSDFNNYSYDVRVKVDYRVKDGSSKSTNWYNAVTDYPYERNSQYDLNTGEPVKRDPSIAEDYRLNRDIMTKFDWQGVDMTKILSFHVEIRNRCGNKCSNWVSIESQMDGSNSTSVKDDNGNVVEDDNYHATNTDNSDDSKYYDSDPKNNSSYIGNNSNFSATSFIQYIKDGFGLLGSGGLIALMAGLFSFIPGSIWTLIKAGIAAGIMIMLISLTVSAVSSIISTLGGK